VVSTVGLVIAGLTMGTWWALVGMSIAAIGFLTGSYAGGLYGLALFGLVSAFVCAFFLHIPDPTTFERASEVLRAAE